MVLTPDDAKKKAKEEQEQRRREPIERLEKMIDAELIRNNGKNTTYELRDSFAKYVLEEIRAIYREAGWNVRLEEPGMEDYRSLGYIVLQRRE